jgi:hypothetical protein
MKEMANKSVPHPGGNETSFRSGPTISLADVSIALHYLAALILSLFSASHFAFLAIQDQSHGFPNPVFPFLSNRALYTLAAVFEIAAALFCFKWRGQTRAHAVILLFTATMIWYGWAFAYTGGTNCGCLGLLGPLVPIDRQQEKAIRIVTLIVLTLTAAPGIFGALRAAASRTGRAIGIVLGFVVGSVPVVGFAAEQTIEVRGIVHAANYNPHTGQVHSETDARSSFVAVISGSSWKVSVTNEQRPGLMWWAERFYDGTNTYVFKPASGSFWRTNPPQGGLRLATISPSENAITMDGDPLGAALVSLTYGLSPKSLKPNSKGFIEMPLPWTSTRNNPDVFGFKWVLDVSEGDRFLREFRVYRESALDMSLREEMLRWELDYPESVAEFNAYQQMLANRMASPSYLRAHYKCTEWLQTNGLSIPKISRLEVFHLQPSNNPARIFKLEAKEFLISDRAEKFIPQITTDTKVFDYRYKKADSEQIFKYAEYTLNPGEPLKAGNDPLLLATAEDWLKNGRKFTVFAESGKRRVTWLVLLVLFIPALIMLLKKTKPNQQTKENT